MNEHIAFLHAIRADPDDDTVRLAFADWLDERADPLGEFIRVQIELEPIRFRIDDPRADELHAREDELLRKHRDEWIGGAAHFPNPTDFGPVFRRGFPDYACLSLDTFLTQGEALFAAVPTLREVALYGLANRGSELTMCPLLAKLDTLEIADWLTEDDAISLSVSPHLDRISRFKLWVGGEPYFLRELAKQAGATWPHEIELVQVCGGTGCFTRFEATRARERNVEADSFAGEANKACSRELVRVTRPFERAFPLSGKISGTCCAGHLPDGSKVLAGGSVHHWFLATFTEGGHCQSMNSRSNDVHYQFRAGTPEFRLELDAAFQEWVQEDLRLKPGLIWVREFDESDLRVALWPRHISEYIADPNPHREATTTGSEFDWQNRGGEARGWLEYRNFVIDNNRETWATWRGQTYHLEL
ncbi:Uncharacterized protein OS=Sorangium cellulosum So0157-2 GN=SCE1572_06350 PE=4 SV=1 [Gemmata massiliana]|uniref:Repeat-companion domain TIGR02996 n=1 Tax=Gemmata massiliana TaxID=1210884 RepID=A0A6P2DK72_9BACT|nr:TIGR02996 domain-containing protein [Gemmata massiliana]VTS03740.1 Uncharacterized protein OS=Sorangium cellulosum So0157-2 GN=SCE1572_06350 PE=4 SV=1 [Gemmata massiliana]